jgi:para-nitrobenzyl esterase
MRILLGCLSAALLLLAAPVANASTVTTPDHGGGPVVRVDTGLLRGSQADGVDSFLGVPYARPPVGALRWRPPQPPRPWSGIRTATAYGNRCPALASSNGPESTTEDCLFLNVQRPSWARPGDRLPVYFWIHGGGLVNGSSNQHDGTQLVNTGNVIVVTINYRLGALGFLALPALTAEAGQSGNYGFLDQEAALRWVHGNIGAFGGDPARVTIGGESAGGWSVCSHLAAPGSRGLFSGAIMESGSCVATETLPKAQTEGTGIATALGCTDAATAAACLRTKSVTDILQATATDNSFMMVHGVPALPQDPDVAVADGTIARVPVLIGANRDEGRTFAAGFIGQTQAQYTAWVQTFGPEADAILAHYPWPADSDKFTAAYLAGAIFTDAGLVGGIGGCVNNTLVRQLSRVTPVFAYEFDHRTGPGLVPIPGYAWGAGHAAELAYMWPSFDNGTPIAPTFDAAERQLAGDMSHYWTAFVATGRPSAPDSARWPSFNTGNHVLSLRAGGHSTPIPDSQITAEHQCAFWSSIPSPN